MSEQTTEKTLGQVGYDTYGETHQGAGPWKTFDGRDMPRWDALQGEAGVLTKVRWEAQAEAVGQEYMRRQGFAWDALAHRWYQPGAKGSAVNWNRTTGA